MAKKYLTQAGRYEILPLTKRKRRKKKGTRKKVFAKGRKRLTQAGNCEILQVTIKEKEEQKSKRKKVFGKAKKVLDTSKQTVVKET